MTDITNDPPQTIDGLSAYVNGILDAMRRDPDDYADDPEALVGDLIGEVGETDATTEQSVRDWILYVPAEYRPIIEAYIDEHHSSDVELSDISVIYHEVRFEEDIDEPDLRPE